MTRTRALVAIISGGLLFEVAAILGMAAVGLAGPILSLGAIVPLAITSVSSALVIEHFGPYDRRDDGEHRHRG
jgi:hypothetical protein